MRPIVRWFKRHLEAVVFLAAVGLLATLVVWWAVFARRLISEHEAVSKDYLVAVATNQTVLAAELASLHERATRQRTMIAGEMPTFGLLMFCGVGALFVLARARRRDHERMERLLQFTTHELKTPVAGVRALLQSFKLGSIPEAQKEKFLDQGIGECNRLEHLAETILAYQRAVAQPSTQVVARSETLLSEVLEHRSRTFGAEGLQWQRGLAVQLTADRDAFRVVVENLLDNARKYGGGGAVELVESRHGNRWHLEVKDHGIGFEPKVAEALFEPFSRHAKEATHGNGLGLYLSRQLARQLGGALWASSEGPGKGSTFVFELPCAADAPAPLAPPRGANA